MHEQLFADGVYGAFRSKQYVLLIFKSAICICLFHHIHRLSLHVHIWGRRGRARMVVELKPIQSVPITNNVLSTNPPQAMCTR